MEYIIEGNIGSGKSTVLCELSKNDKIEVFYEPLDAWNDIQDKDGKSLLDIFYEDPKRYSYLFQSIVFKTRLRYLEVEQKREIRLMERSILTDYNVFMKTLLEMDMMSDIERECYEQWYGWLKDKCFKNPTGIIYIRSTPETCMERIQLRNRSAEVKITLDYLKTIHDKHEKWLSEWNECPVYVVDNPVGKPIAELANEINKCFAFPLKN